MSNLPKTINPNNREQAVLSGRAIGTLVLGALVTGLVAGAFAAYRTLNSDHFLIISLGDRVTAIEQSRAETLKFIPEFQVLKSQSEDTRSDIAEIKTDIKEIHQILRSL